MGFSLDAPLATQNAAFHNNSILSSRRPVTCIHVRQTLRCRPTARHAGPHPDAHFFLLNIWSPCTLLAGTSHTSSAPSATPNCMIDAREKTLTRASQLALPLHLQRPMGRVPRVDPVRSIRCHELSYEPCRDGRFGQISKQEGLMPMFAFKRGV